MGEDIRGTYRELVLCERATEVPLAEVELQRLQCSKADRSRVVSISALMDERRPRALFLLLIPTISEAGSTHGYIVPRELETQVPNQGTSSLEVRLQIKDWYRCCLVIAY